MKRTTLSLVLLLLFPTACQGLPAATESQTAATSIPIASLDLSSIVITPGDLPAGYEADQIPGGLGDLPDNAPSPDAFFSQNLSYNDGPGGQITILLYEDELKIEPTYELIANQMPGEAELVDVGEIAKVASNSSDTSTVTLTFVRCHAVTSIQWIGTSNIDDILSYAVDLDKRLSPFICRTDSHE